MTAQQERRQPAGTEVTRSYLAKTVQYRLGLASNTFTLWLWVSMILFNFNFICVCLAIIFVLGGWLPETEPTTLLCTTLLDVDGNCRKKACPDLTKSRDVQADITLLGSQPKNAWSFHIFTTYGNDKVLAFAWTQELFTKKHSASRNESVVSPQMQNAAALTASIRTLPILPGLPHHRYSGNSGSSSEPFQAATDPEAGNPRHPSEIPQGIPLHEFDNSPKDSVSQTDSS